MNIHRVTSGESEQGTPTRYKLQAKCGCRPFNTSNLEDIFLSEKAEFRTAGSGVFRVPDDSHTDDIWYSPLWYSRNSSSTLFPLHEACIETSCRAIDHLLSQRADIEHEPTLAILYRFLNTRFLERHKAEDENRDPFRGNANDILDLSHCSKLYGPRSVLAMTRLEWWGGEYDVRITKSRKAWLTFDRNSMLTLSTFLGSTNSSSTSFWHRHKIGHRNALH
jgi:hypothetical protein